MNLTHEHGISFLSKLYQEKNWQYRGQEENTLFFDTIDGNNDYEQVYLIQGKSGFEILYDWDSGYSSPYKQPYDLSNDMANFNNDTVGTLNSIGMDQYTYRYSGSNSTDYVNKFSQDKSQHFIQIVKDGLDVSLQKGSRSTFELSSHIDFDKLTLDFNLSHENLLLNYANYIAHRICILFDYVEDLHFYDMIAKNNFDDSLVDMLFVLDKIKAANTKAGYIVQLNPSLVNNIQTNLLELQEEIKIENKFNQEQIKELDKILKKLLVEIKKNE